MKHEYKRNNTRKWRYRGEGEGREERSRSMV
jgi:hypothetical protein